MASLSCALGEAFFLNRTLLFPDRICLDVRHAARWQPVDKPVDEHCSFAQRKEKVAAISIPTGELLDLADISQLVPLQLVELPRSPKARLHGFTPPAAGHTVTVDRRWRSERIASELPCGAPHAALVRRHVSSFWFRPCSYNIAQSSALVARLARAVAAPPERLPPASQLLPHMIRSGLFYAPPIKQAARSIRRRIGSGYVAIHVRRSDKFATGCDRMFATAECDRMKLITRPEALVGALEHWYPNGSTIYVSSTEPADFFAALRRQHRVYVPEDFGNELLPITNNYALYAVETLLLFGASSVVQTFGYAVEWFANACFPAASLWRPHSPGGKSDGAALTKSTRRGTGTHRDGGSATSSTVAVECRGTEFVRVNGVLYGAACSHNPPCGQMSFVPGKGETPHGCGQKLRMAHASLGRGTICD